MTFVVFAAGFADADFYFCPASVKEDFEGYEHEFLFFDFAFEFGEFGFVDEEVAVA